jgi:hypothetical protein
MNKNVSKYLAWLQIVLGVYFLGFAAYRYIGNGYDWDKVNVPVTIIFGITFPLMAVARLVGMNRKSKQID